MKLNVIIYAHCFVMLTVEIYRHCYFAREKTLNWLENKSQYNANLQLKQPVMHFWKGTPLTKVHVSLIGFLMN